MLILLLRVCCKLIRELGHVVKAAVKIESAQEHERSRGRKHLLHATLHDLHIYVLVIA